jgi:hypothetical protein
MVHSACKGDVHCRATDGVAIDLHDCCMTTPNRATTTAAVVALVLGLGIVATAAMHPYALAGLAPVLLALAAVVRAVKGFAAKESSEDDEAS